jgi:hypothetical protein
VLARAQEPRKRLASCARRRPGSSLEDAGSIPATSTFNSYGERSFLRACALLTVSPRGRACLLNDLLRSGALGSGALSLASCAQEALHRLHTVCTGCYLCRPTERYVHVGFDTWRGGLIARLYSNSRPNQSDLRRLFLPDLRGSDLPGELSAAIAGADSIDRSTEVRLRSSNRRHGNREPYARFLLRRGPHFRA